MCIAVPMRVLEVRSDSDVVVTRPGRTEIANASFADEMPAGGGRGPAPPPPQTNFSGHYPIVTTIPPENQTPGISNPPKSK